MTSKQPGIESSTGAPKAERPRGTALKAKRVTQQGSDKTSRPESIKMINTTEQNRPNEGRTVAGSISSDPAGCPQFIRDSFGRGPTDPAKRSFAHSELTDSPKENNQGKTHGRQETDSPTAGSDTRLLMRRQFTRTGDRDSTQNTSTVSNLHLVRKDIRKQSSIFGTRPHTDRLIVAFDQPNRPTPVIPSRPMRMKSWGGRGSDGTVIEVESRSDIKIRKLGLNEPET